MVRRGAYDRIHIKTKRIAHFNYKSGNFYKTQKGYFLFIL